jgi:hypothetical protein
MAVQHTEFYVFAQGDSAEEHHVVTSELQFELMDLNKFTEYSVWVVAFNQNGPGSSTEEVVCRTLSDVPSEPPQNITLEASSSTVSDRNNISATVETDVCLHSKAVCSTPCKWESHFYHISGSRLFIFKTPYELVSSDAKLEAECCTKPIAIHAATWVEHPKSARTSAFRHYES